MKETKNQWFAKRAQLYDTLASDKLPEKKDVTIHLSDPDAGWIDMEIRFNGKTIETISLTNIWGDDPLGELVRWLESVHSEDYAPSSLFHDGEAVEIIFMFDPFNFSSDEQDKNHPDYYQMGAFSIFIRNANAEERMNYAVCDRTTFVKNWYSAICNFAKRQKKNPSLIKEWAGELYCNKNSWPGSMSRGVSDTYKATMTKRMMDNLHSDKLQILIEKKEKQK
jgi:hypothetical protein